MATQCVAPPGYFEAVVTRLSSARRLRQRIPLFAFSHALSSSSWNLQNHCSRKCRSAIACDENVSASSSTAADAFRLTFLEGNSWLWDIDGVKILVDPILVGNLDFGIPWLYDASKKVIKNYQLSDLPKLDLLLITQSLDDHCHMKTLAPLAQRVHDLKVEYLEPGESSDVVTENGSRVKIQATAGPVLGPPWQRPENGYLVRSSQGTTLYYEPHCVYDKERLAHERADIVITPVIKQLLPGLTLVSGQEDAVQLVKALQAKIIVPMKNGDLESKGILSLIIRGEGTMESFKDLLNKEIPGSQVLVPTPGVPLDVLVV